MSRTAVLAAACVLFVASAVSIDEARGEPMAQANMSAAVEAVAHAVAPSQDAAGPALAASMSSSNWSAMARSFQHAGSGTPRPGAAVMPAASVSALSVPAASVSSRSSVLAPAPAEPAARTLVAAARPPAAVIGTAAIGFALGPTGNVRGSEAASPVPAFWTTIKTVAVAHLPKKENREFRVMLAPSVISNGFDTVAGVGALGRF